MKKVPFIFFTLLIFSCSSLKQNLNKEFIEFNHKNYVVIKDDQINIKLIPDNSGRKQNVRVEIIYEGKKLDDRTISKSDFDEIKRVVKNINRDDLVMPRIINEGNSNEHLVGIPDGGQNSITISENDTETKYATTGFSQEYHKSFYHAVEKIFSTINLELKNL